MTPARRIVAGRLIDLNRHSYEKQVDSHLCAVVSLVMHLQCNRGSHTGTAQVWRSLASGKTQQQRFVSANLDGGVHCLECVENWKRNGQATGVRPTGVLEARHKILELEGPENGRPVLLGWHGAGPTPLVSKIDACLGHLRANQKLNTFRSCRRVGGTRQPAFCDRRPRLVVIRLLILDGEIVLVAFG